MTGYNTKHVDDLPTDANQSPNPELKRHNMLGTLLYLMSGGKKETDINFENVLGVETVPIVDGKVYQKK